MLFEDIHTHTCYSHGKGTPEDIVIAALSCGLQRIGISEHGPLHLFFPVKYPALLKLRKEIDYLQDKYGDRIRVEMGLEANLLGDGLTDIPEDTSLFDYMLMGYHKGTPALDPISRRWRRGILLPSSKKYARENAQAYIRAMDQVKNLVAITHPGTYIPVDIAYLSREAAARNVALEINESHRNFNEEALLIAKAEGARFLISSDAHKPQYVGQCSRSIALARACGALERVINFKTQ